MSLNTPAKPSWSGCIRSGCFASKVVLVSGRQIDVIFIRSDVDPDTKPQSQVRAWSHDDLTGWPRIKSCSAKRIGGHEAVVAGVPPAWPEVVGMWHHGNPGKAAFDRPTVVAPVGRLAPNSCAVLATFAIDNATRKVNRHTSLQIGSPSVVS